MSVDNVRLLIGDTDSTDELLTDDNILFLLEETSDNAYLAASMAAQAIAAKYARQVSESKSDSHGLHNQRRELSDRYKHYKELAETLQKRYQNQSGINGLGATGVYAGGISKANKTTVSNDTDRVAPSFTRELHDNNE